MGPLEQAAPPKLIKVLDRLAAGWREIDAEWGDWLQGRSERHACQRAVLLTRAVRAADPNKIVGLIGEYRRETAVRPPPNPVAGSVNNAETARSGWSRKDVAELRRSYQCSRFNGRALR